MSGWIKTAALSLLLVLSACTSPPSIAGSRAGGGGTGGAITASGAGATPLRVELSIPFTPQVGQEVEVHLKVTSGEAVKDVEAGLILPQGAEVVGGQTKEVFDLSAGQSAGLSAVIRFAGPGQYSVSGQAQSDLGGGTVWSDMATLQLTVGEQAGAVLPPQADCSQNPASCLPPPTEPAGLTECPPPHTDPAASMRVALNIPAAARVNEVITGTLVVCSTQEARQVQVRVELPQGVKLAQGDAAWLTDLPANQPVAYTLLFSFASAGEFQVGAAALSSAAGGSDSTFTPVSVAP